MSIFHFNAELGGFEFDPNSDAFPYRHLTGDHECHCDDSDRLQSAVEDELYRLTSDGGHPPHACHCDDTGIAWGYGTS